MNTMNTSFSLLFLIACTLLHHASSFAFHRLPLVSPAHDVVTAAASRSNNAPPAPSSKLFMSSQSTFAQASPRGCAATPLDKKQVAVFGAGGYLGGTIFGMCQRASNLYGTGIGGPATPRLVSATAEGSMCLNKILSKGFKLAYAGEQMVRLVNMADVNHVTERLRGIDAAFLGTVNSLEFNRPVTGNTYEASPNDKTVEFFFDSRRTVFEDENPISEDELMQANLNLFESSVAACKEAGVKHLVVIESPSTKSTAPFAKILDEARVPFTFIYVNGESSWVNAKDWTFEKGVVRKGGDLTIDHATLTENYVSKPGYETGDWADSLPVVSASTIYREDIAAVAVQSLMSLDWERSRCIGVGSQGGDEVECIAASKRSDREWCVNSSELAQMLSSVE